MTDDTFTQEDGTDLDNVTRAQGGQFIDEGQDIIRVGDPLDDLYDVPGEAQLVQGSTGRVNALQVTMDRSGADFIHAQKVFLTNSGAQQITGGSTKLIQSGALQLKADTAELHQSSAVIANVGSMTTEGGTIVSAQAKDAHLGAGTHVSFLQAGNVKADGDVHAFMMMSGNVTAGGNVTTTLSTAGAAAFGAVFGVVVVILSKLFGRGDD